jgi:hypothetical protein
VSQNHADGTATITRHLFRTDDLIEDACRRVSRNLTPLEWQRYVGPDLEYNRTCPSLPAGADVVPDPKNPKNPLAP